MSDGQTKPRWWLIGVAAVMAVLMVFDSLGTWAGVGLCALFLASLLGYFWFRSRQPEKPAEIRCIRCGETLRPTARNCPYCGSASWTYKN
jgi:hypothetical protein